MTAAKDSAEVINFMPLFARLKDWSEDEAASRPV
jgi:hypothetical protein